MVTHSQQLPKPNPGIGWIHSMFLHQDGKQLVAVFIVRGYDQGFRQYGGNQRNGQRNSNGGLGNILGGILQP